MISAVSDKFEIKGTLDKNPLAELLHEFMEAKLTGSFRVNHQDYKVVVYLNAGSVAFAVSNQRQYRLFEILLKRSQVSEKTLAGIPEFVNDFALRDALSAGKLISEAEIESALHYQIRSILESAFKWESGGWSFSPLARVKETINFDIGFEDIAINFAREMPDTALVTRFKSLNENFGINSSRPPSIDLRPQEAYIVSRFGENLMRVREVKDLSGLSDLETMKFLYALWLGNFLVRKNWDCVLSEQRIRQILSAKLSLIKRTAPKLPKIEVEFVKIDEPVAVTEAAHELEKKRAAADERQAEEVYLARIENAESYYEMLKIPVEASLFDIKNAYFNLAKTFHPDRYHQEGDAALQQRIQNAFAEIAHAYEILKNDSKRETYDYRLKKYFESKMPVSNSARSKKTPDQHIAENAIEEFQRGFDLIMRGDYQDALPFLMRATQMDGRVAKYHAFYGKALSLTGAERVKAESEIQAAIKLDPGSQSFRIMLVELYIQFESFRRAEGELDRMLAAFPENREARELRASLPKK